MPSSKPAKAGAGHPAPPTPGHSASIVDDISLVHRIAGGETDAYETLYDRWVEPVYAIALAVLRNRDEAEDVVEDTFRGVWDEAPKQSDVYAGLPGQARRQSVLHNSAGSWILALARTSALQRLRTKQRRTNVSLEDRAALVPEFSLHAKDAEISEQHIRVHAALQSLPGEQRRMLELAYFGGFTSEELATVTGETSSERVEIQLSRSLQQFAQVLGIAAISASSENNVPVAAPDTAPGHGASI